LDLRKLTDDRLHWVDDGAPLGSILAGTRVKLSGDLPYPALKFDPSSEAASMMAFADYLVYGRASWRQS
jgi:hypothetical protein